MLVRSPSLGRLAGGIALVLLAAGCRDATEVRLAIGSDVCDTVTQTAIVVAAPGALESTEPVAVADGCASDRIGSLTVVPRNEPDEPWALRVVTSVDGPVSACEPPEYGPQCIVARRSLRFIEDRGLDLPIAMRGLCLGVLCPEGQTCVSGVCRGDACADPSSPECDEEGLPAVGLGNWKLGVGGEDADLANDLDRLPGGDLLVGGEVTGPLDLGNGPTAEAGGAKDGFVARIGPTGTPLWSLVFGGTGPDSVTGVGAGVTGLAHVVGVTDGGLDAGSGPLSAGGNGDVFVATFGGLGTPIWSRAYGGSGFDIAHDVAAGPDGSVYVVGTFHAAIDFDGIALAGEGHEGFVASFDAAGAVRWAASIGGDAADDALGVAVGEDGHVYVVGMFEGDATVGGQPLVPRGNRDAFVVSFDAGSGDVRWAHGFGDGGSNDDAGTVAARPGGGVAVGGSLGGPGSIGEVAIQLSDRGGYAVELDSDGVAQRVHLVETEFGGDVEVLRYAADGELILAGNFNGATSIGGITLPDRKTRELFLASMGADGASWANAYLAGQFASFRGLATNPDGSLFLAGGFDTELEIDGTTFVSNGGVDIFVGRIPDPETP